MPRHVLRLHLHLVNAWVFVAMLDGLVRHRQVLVDGPHPVAEVHLILGAAGVALMGSNSECSADSNRTEGKAELAVNGSKPTLSWWTMNVMSSPGATANICPLMVTRRPSGGSRGQLCCLALCSLSSPPSHMLDTIFL